MTENRTVQGLTSFFTLVALNLIHVVACLPVITIGAASAALLETMDAVRQNPDTDMLRTYGHALKTDTLRGSIVFWAIALPAALAAFAVRFWWSTGGAPGAIAAVIAALLALYLAASAVHGLLLVATRDTTASRTIHNALLLPAVVPARSLFLVLVPITEVALAIALPPSLIIILTVGLAVGALLQSAIAAPLYARLS
ncbi:YesL family protein [Actinomyces sp. MRS3W]|uniref:YesL family protein n=1 Tax=Actinomyces sp. MRS3W TaxID=2800796 RepID=UPI0028FD9F18|nr:YesL family protein [Actinomyces sp. MRS3W]MDU0349348.1 YesL family protein [Actinomyces sp. MRS3W]